MRYIRIYWHCLQEDTCMEEEKKLYNRDFVLMLQGSAVSRLGDILYSVAIGYWVYEKTGSNTLLGFMSSISSFMAMFLSPFTGSITDKLNRKHIIVGMDVIRGIVMVLAGILAMRDSLTTGMVLVFAFIAALCAQFFDPSVSTAMIDIIPHSRMVQGQSAFNGLNSLINLIGKAVSGMLVTFLGVAPIILLNGISYFLSAFTEAFIRIPKSSQQGNAVTVRSMAHDMKNAVKAIREDPFLRLFIPAALILNLIGAGPMYMILPFCLDKGFSVDFYGILMAVETAGSLICVLILSVLKLNGTQRYYVLLYGFALSPVLYVIAYITHNQILMLVMFFLGCFTNTMGNAVFNASLTLALPEDNRGAIIGFIQAFSMGGCALSSLVYGMLCDAFSIVPVFVAGTLMTIIPSLVVCLNRKTKTFVETH